MSVLYNFAQVSDDGHIKKSPSEVEERTSEQYLEEDALQVEIE